MLNIVPTQSTAPSSTLSSASSTTKATRRKPRAGATLAARPQPTVTRKPGARSARVESAPQDRATLLANITAHELDRVNLLPGEPLQVAAALALKVHLVAQHQLLTCEPETPCDIRDPEDLDNEARWAWVEAIGEELTIRVPADADVVRWVAVGVGHLILSRFGQPQAVAGAEFIADVLHGRTPSSSSLEGPSLVIDAETTSRLRGLVESLWHGWWRNGLLRDLDNLANGRRPGVTDELALRDSVRSLERAVEIVAGAELSFRWELAGIELVSAVTPEAHHQRDPEPLTLAEALDLEIHAFEWEGSTPEQFTDTDRTIWTDAVLAGVVNVPRCVDDAGRRRWVALALGHVALERAGLEPSHEGAGRIADALVDSDGYAEANKYLRTMAHGMFAPPATKDLELQAAE